MIRFPKLVLMPLVFVAALALADPARAANLAEPKAGSAGCAALSLQVIPSGWRLELTMPRGAGAIVRIDPAGRGSYYTGEGCCRQWSQQQLASMYMSIVRSLDTDHADLPPVG